MIRMRFAPSPTGVLHIGNARTAIFGYLLAKHYKGQFFLRIEDTDLSRSKQEYTDILMDSLKFLGIHWDNPEVIYQSKRFDLYRNIAEELVSLGYAYKCYMTAEEIEAIKVQGKAFRSIYRETAEQPIDRTEYVIRFKVLDGMTSFEDSVCDTVSINNNDIEDFVLLRSDGAPTFILCCTVDDNDMQINYVLRGVDHLINTAKQIMIFKAMNWDIPKYAHIPLILDSTGKKLSKRDGDIGVLDYAKRGILPQAIINCLMRLSWGHKNEEFIPLERAIEIFDESGFSKSSARFDEVKLLDLSGKYMRYLPAEQICDYAKKYAKDILQQEYSEIGWSRFTIGLSELTARAKTLAELLDVGKIFLTDIRHTEASEIKTSLSEFFTTDLIQILKDNTEAAVAIEQIELSFRQYCLSHGLIFGEIARVLRMRLSNSKVSPGLFMMIYVLGANECMARI